MKPTTMKPTKMKKPLAALVLVATVTLVGASCRPVFPWRPTSPPPAPRNVDLVAGDRSITATFDRGSRLGAHARVRGYRLTCTAPPVSWVPPLGPGWSVLARSWPGGPTSVEGRRSPLVLSLPDQMINGVTFTCTVQAVTRTGVGAPSPALDVTPVGPPRVAGVQPIPTSSGAALVFVNVFLESSGFTDFACEVDAPGTVTPASGCSFTTTGLEPDTQYDATVTPSTSDGIGEPVTFAFTTGP